MTIHEVKKQSSIDKVGTPVEITCKNFQVHTGACPS
jgi:hypothetical protein